MAAQALEKLRAEGGERLRGTDSLAWVASWVAPGLFCKSLMMVVHQRSDAYGPHARKIAEYRRCSHLLRRCSGARAGRRPTASYRERQHRQRHEPRFWPQN